MKSPPQERDRVRSRTTVIVFALSVLTMIASLAAVAGFLVYRPHGKGPIEPPTRPSNAEQLRAAQEKQLHGYGYVDGDKTIAHIPIEQAIDIVSTEAP
jgi:hypothetical protein